MTDSGDSVDWSRLPHDPVGFFRLQPGFDRRQLKRQYNQFIRLYKPEQHPQEFQRIRAAYELLDLQLRYGDDAKDSTGDGDDSAWRPAREVSPPQRKEVFVPARADVSRTRLVDRIRTEAPDALHRELAARAHKTPHDYYALAILSDLVDDGADIQFANWLLQGLRVYPRDQGLYLLLQQFLRSPIALNEIPVLLSRISHEVHENAFFPLTEPLWDRLLRNGSFPLFQQTLEQCESILPGLMIDNRLTFYVHTLKAAMWQADAVWVERTMAFIEQNFTRLPSHLEWDMEQLAMLRDYFAVRTNFLNGSPLRESLDDAIRDYFAGDERLGDHQVLACQMRVLDQTAELLAAFSDFNEQNLGPFYRLWLWITYEVAERNSVALTVHDDGSWQTQVWRLLERLDEKRATSKLGMRWSLGRLGYGFLYVTCYVLPCAAGFAIAVLLLPKRNDDYVGPILLPVLIVSGLLGHWVKSIVVKRWAVPFNARKSEEIYRALWREEIIALQQSTSIPPRAISAIIAPLTRPGANWHWIMVRIDNDVALVLFALAQRFLV